MHTDVVSFEAPAPLPLGISDEGAIALCRDWMVYLGAVDTTVAYDSSKSVCDLFSSRYLAWVNNQRGSLELSEVRRAAQIAARDGRQPIIFKRGGIRLDAQRQANLDRIALFLYIPSDGILEGGNALGFQLRDLGLSA